METKHYIKWIKKLVSIREWNSWYKHNHYTFLAKDEKGVWVGFLVADIIPKNCLVMNDEELLLVDAHRRGVGIFPTPLEYKEIQKPVNEINVKELFMDPNEGQECQDFWEKIEDKNTF